MSDEIVSHEAIESAFKPAAEIIARLPDGIERRRATENLKISEDYVHQGREKIKPAG